MLSKSIPFVMFLYFCIKYSTCITNGKIVETEKRFVVYLLKAPTSTKEYIGWLCGGAIVTHKHIITSAACVIDVRHIYVISGYNKYVPSSKIDEDECTKRKKRKIIHTCVPKIFSEADMMEKVEKWNWGDIAVAVVDVPFNFMDKTYQIYCSYPPNPIEINMHEVWQRAKTNVLAYGWGTSKYQRPINDARDYNERFLRYSAGKLSLEFYCKRFFSEALNKWFRFHFSRVLLCVTEFGEIDERGENIEEFGKIYENCLTIYYPDNEKTKLNNDEKQSQMQKCIQNTLRNGSFDPELIKVPGICQNDHGGPLTTWRGGKEILIGVASLFVTTQNMQCRAPYGYTSTACHNKFLTCVIWPHRIFNDNNTRRALNCDDPPERRGYHVLETHISWADHPDGPAETEFRRSGPLNHGYDSL